jgi:hypothetical protein
MVVGATRLARMFGRSRGWARRLLREWEVEQAAGGPTRVFRQGKQSGLYTTIRAIQSVLPAAKDVVVYERLAEIETELGTINARVDREVVRAGEIERRLTRVESRR